MRLSHRRKVASKRCRSPSRRRYLYLVSRQIAPQVDALRTPSLLGLFSRIKSLVFTWCGYA